MNKYSDMKRPQSSKSRNLKQDLRSLDSFVISAISPTHRVPTAHSSLSNLAQLENLRAYGKRDSVISRNKALPLSGREFSSKRPSEKDFVTLINKLETVISNKASGVRKLNLAEGTSPEITLEQGITNYFRVHVKDKKTPLKVTINRSLGRIRSFVSKTISEPSELLCDEIFKTDHFQVTESHLSFKIEYVYIAVHAIDDSKFSVTLKFGNEKKAQAFARPKNVESWDDLELHQRMPKKKSKTQKNFIKRNMKIEPPNSAKATEEGKKKTSIWHQRRIEAVKRKSAVVKEKKERTVYMLNKMAEKHAQEKREREDWEQKCIIQAKQKVWMVLMYGVVMISTVRQLSHMNRSSVLGYLQQNNSARMIQKNFRKKAPTAGTINMGRANHLLKMYSRNTFDRKEREIALCVKESASDQAVHYQFSKFIRTIIRIQRAWRTTLEESKNKWQVLISCWNKAISTLVVGTDRTSSAKKKNKDIPDPSIYILISAIARNHILKAYLLKKKREFRTKIRMYLDSANCVKRNIVQRITDEEGLVEDGFPEFEYIPSQEEMIELIEEARKNSQVSNK